MSRDDFTKVLGFWEGYGLGKVERYEGGGTGRRARVELELIPLSGGPMKCSGCGTGVMRVHETTKRRVRDLPIFDAETHLVVHRRRVLCGRCGPKLEELSWLGRYERVTRRLSQSVARLCSVLPVKHVAEYFALDRKTVKRIDKSHLAESLGPVELSGIRVIAMDEFSIQKGHRYATVVVEPQIRRVLWVGRGRGREDIRPFFDLLGHEGCRELKAVVMDMNGAYAQEVRSRCPGAEIVYDLFHVVAKYGREVIDRVRVDEANRLRGARKARKVIKGARWLLLRNKENIHAQEDKVRLRELLAANKALATVYVLKDDLKHLWDYRYPKAALRFWTQWYRRAMYSGITPLKKFARRLKEYLSGILAHCRWPFHTSVLEGINNKIKVIKRMAYGFHDDQYFFLKIRAAFPGNRT